MVRALLPLLVILLLASPRPAHAQTVTIYRCTDAKGALTIQNGTPCPKGSKQTMQKVDQPTVIPDYKPPPKIVTTLPDATPPAPAAAASTTAPADVARPEAPPPAAIADADRLPPPPIFRCTTWENDAYLSEDPEPKPRCVQLQTTGLAGNPDNGAGQACEMKYDLCARVPDEKICDAWKQRQREIESTWRYAPGADKQRWQDEFARAAKILGDTTCGK